jgi:hypothetical protein
VSLWIAARRQTSILSRAALFVLAQSYKLLEDDTFCFRLTIVVSSPTSKSKVMKHEPAERRDPQGFGIDETGNGNGRMAGHA